MPNQPFHPPLVLQSTESEFEAAIRKEFIEGSAIAETLFDVAVQISGDTEIQYGEAVSNPIADFLNWDTTEKAGFKNRNMLAALLYNEDGTPFQAKLNQQTWDSKKERYGKPYKAPKGFGGFPRAYLPPISSDIRESLGLKPEGSFWDQVEADPSIPINIPEGTKKSLSGLSNGHVTIGLYGCDAGSKKIDGQHVLIPDLKRFCQPGRVFILALDKDSNPETVERVNRAIGRLTWLLRKEDKSITVKVATWDGSRAKGLDDLVVNCGVEALHKAISEAKEPPREKPFSCLPCINYQIGERHTIKNRKTGEEEEIFKPRTDFDLQVTKLMNDREGGGLELIVSWLARSRVMSKTVYIKSCDLEETKTFKRALSRALGYPVSCTLKPDQLADILQNRRSRYSLKGGEYYRIAPRLGQQEDGVWVFENGQFNKDGTPTSESESLWVFNQELCEREHLPSPKIAPQNPEALKNLAHATQAFYSPQALPYVWLAIGFAVMGLHYQDVRRLANAAPSLSMTGDRGGGKSIAQKIAASLYGLHEHLLGYVTVSAFYERGKNMGSLPIQWEDPIRNGRTAQTDEDNVNMAIQSLYDRSGRTVRGNKQIPETVVSVTTNRPLGGENAAILSRMIAFNFPVFPVNRKMAVPLEKAMAQASGGFSQLIAIPYTEEIHQTVTTQGETLMESLDGSHARNGQSLSTLAYFTQKFCEIAEVDFDALAFIKSDICPQTNEQGAGKDSLTDFLEKVAVLKSEGRVGAWNVVDIVTREGKKCIAVNLASVWPSFESRFHPNYGSSSIAAIAETKGGKKKHSVKFIETEDIAKAYNRARANFDMHLEGAVSPTPPVKSRSASALLIPLGLAEEAGLFSDSKPYNPDDYPDEEPENLKSPEIVEKVTSQVTLEAIPETSLQPTVQPQVTEVIQVTPENARFPENVFSPTGLPIGSWEHEPNKPNWEPTHRTAKGTEVIVLQEIGGGRVACQKASGGKFQTLKSELTPIGGVLCEA